MEGDVVLDRAVTEPGSYALIGGLMIAEFRRHFKISGAHTRDGRVVAESKIGESGNYSVGLGGRHSVVIEYQRGALEHRG